MHHTGIKERSDPELKKNLGFPSWPTLGDTLPEESQLLWPEDHECVSLAALPPGCPPHPVDVLFGVVWRVILHYPVNVRNVQT
jgi:hypothetical protein